MHGRRLIEYATAWTSQRVSEYCRGVPNFKPSDAQKEEREAVSSSIQEMHERCRNVTLHEAE